MNHVNLIGKVSSTPKIVELPDGRRIVQFTMSTKEKFIDAEGKAKTKSNWHRMMAWGRWVRVLEELGSEGMDLAVEGKLVTRFYQSAGKKQMISEVEVNDLIIL
ncbi:MAG: single-stranded DNA-binding protein [Bacteroidota bacterium]